MKYINSIIQGFPFIVEKQNKAKHQKQREQGREICTCNYSFFGGEWFPLSFQCSQ